MPTTVTIPPPVNIDVDADAVPSPFASITSAPFIFIDGEPWNDDGQLVIHFPDDDLTDDVVNAIINFAQINPPAELPGDVAPGTVNTPEIIHPGTKSLGIKWEAITNASSVMYDVYLSAVPGAYAPANFLGTTAATMVVSNTLPDGTPLTHGTTYYWAIQTRSGVEMGPVSSEVSGSLVQINSPDLAVGSVVTDALGAGVVTSEKVESLFVVSGTFTTAETGERSGISAAEGHFGYAPDGRLIFQVNGGQGFLDGEFVARSLTIVEGATWSGMNVGNPGGSTMMGDKLGAPGVAPTVEPIWDEIPLVGSGTLEDVSKRRGLVWHNSHWWVASQLDTGSVRVMKFDAAGAHVDDGDGITWSGEPPPSSLTLLGPTFYVHFAGTDQVAKFDPVDGSIDGTVTLAGTTSAMRDGVLGSDGTNLILAWRSTSNEFRWQKYTTAGVKTGSEVTGANIFGVPQSVVGGSFDFGAQRIVANTSSTAWVQTTAGVSIDASFPAGELGLCWTGSVFASLSGPTTIRQHVSALATEPGDPLTFVPEFSVASTWYDSNLTGGPHETAKSPSATRAFSRRAKHRITASGPVPSGGGTDDPDGARFYVGRTSGRLKLELQGTASGLLPGATADLEVSSLTLPVGTADATTPPPSSGDFPAGIPYRHYSEAVDSDGDPMFEVDGSGIARGEGLIPVGTIWPYYGSTEPDGWLFLDGGSYSSVTYPKLFAHLGTTTLPDARSRFLVGVGSWQSTLGGNEGDSEASRTPGHTHGPGTLSTGGPSATEENSGSGTQGAGPNHTHNVNGGMTGTGGGINDFPHLAINWMIRAI